MRDRQNAPPTTAGHLLEENGKFIKETSVNFARKDSGKSSFGRSFPRLTLRLGSVVLLGFASLVHSQQPPAVQPPNSGSISGSVVDASGAVVAGARVKLTRGDASPSQETLSGADGQFSFSGVAPGPVQLMIAADGFQAQTTTGTVQPGTLLVVPRVTLPVALAMTEVKVALSAPEIAQEQIEQQEKQRVLGVIPNFYISYVPNAVAMNPRQKFSLAFKTITDPVTFGIVGVIAGVQQAQNDFSGYGQGAAGYAKRYGASYANLASGTLIGGAILPSILKQDPRYFYKGTGTKRSRAFYAIANAVICKGDNGRWQPNYSNMLGSLAAGGLSNLYYPSSDRQGVRLTFETALIGIGVTGAVNVLQEFFIPKFSTNVPKHDSSQP